MFRARRSAATTLTLLLAVVTLVELTAAKELVAARKIVAVPPGAVGPGGVVNLPYFMQDNRGSQWRIYQNGWVQQQGHQALYSQGAQLTINGNQPQMGNNQGRLDEKTGELVLENLNAQGLVVTRRILIDKERSLVRYIDIIKNTGNVPLVAQVQIQTNFNYGINAMQNVGDPKRKGQDVAWVGQTGLGPAVVELFAGKGAKQAFQLSGPPQNSFCQATISPTIPAGKEVALMHLHGVMPTVDQAVQFARELKEQHLLRSIPREIRKILLNFATGQNFIGDVEILRGDVLDVVELKGGDQYKGTLKETSFAIDTFYGKVDLPVDQVIGVINVGRFRPRQLVVLTDGQIYGGRLAKDALDLELSSKQVIKVPLAQVSRVGYRKRDGEPEEWTFDRPVVLMRGGERVGVQMPTEPIAVATRYGKLQIRPDTIAAVVLQAEEHGVHEIRLTDGSRFAGLVEGNSFPMKLANDAAQSVTFPASGVARMQFTNKAADPEADPSIPTMALSNDDVLVGTLAGKLAVDTAFDTIAVAAEEVKSMTHATPASPDVTITLWDGTTLSGQVREPELAFTLSGGLAMKIPVALVREYQQPRPVASAAVVDRIKAIVTNLNAEDWKARDRAEATLTAMGPVAIPVLKGMRDNQPPEAQQRIDSIVKELEKQEGAERGQSPKPAGIVDTPEIDLEIQTQDQG